MSNDHLNDPRRVALIKGSATKNRFYALVPPDSGIQNADEVPEIPSGYLLGIAYPCLEDGLNDFAVIRTTFETLDYFPPDDPLREEMMEIINSARDNLTRRLSELRDKIGANIAHFLGTDYDEFKTYALDMATRGYPRRNLDNMMKVNVFGSVAEQEGFANANELLYQYEFAIPIDLEAAKSGASHPFVVHLFDDVLDSVLDDKNYTGRYMFDRFVFQKFIAVMFINYATTDPMFYGINKKDYGVSKDKDMDETPLYIAIKKELIEIEQRLLKEGATLGYTYTPPVHAEHRTLEEAASEMPTDLLTEESVMGHISSLCSAADLLVRKSDPETQRFARIIMADASKLVADLKKLGIVSQIASDPCICSE